MSRFRRVLLSLPLLVGSGVAWADQTGLGAWNAGATEVAGKSALVTSAMAYIREETGKIADPALRRATEDAVFNRGTCIKSRVGMDAGRKQAVVDRLVSEGLIDPAEAGRIPGGLVAGVFPGVVAEESACPTLPQPYGAAPGSVFGGHHSEPGGLAIHVAVNLTSSRHLADTYREVYGTLDAKGLPVVRHAGVGKDDKDLGIDQDLVLAAPIWHDWGKMMVFQWNADGSEYAEMNFGGNGKTDAWGAAGTTKTGGHHLIGLAESMARGLPPVFIITQASAHGAPNAGNEYSVVNWLRTAAIMVGVDPVERGYLMKDATGKLRLPAVRKLGSVDVLASLPAQSNLLYEYVLHNLSDADYTFTGPAVVQGELLLRTVALQFGYDPADTGRYNREYRNPVMSTLGAERLQILYANGGIERVQAEVGGLKRAGVIK